MLLLEQHLILTWNETFGLVIGEGHGYGLQMLASKAVQDMLFLLPQLKMYLVQLINKAEAFSGQSGSGASDEGELDYTVDPKMGVYSKLKVKGGT